MKLYHALWRDLDCNEPHPARALIYVGLTFLACLIGWATLIAWLAALA